MKKPLIILVILMLLLTTCASSSAKFQGSSITVVLTDIYDQSGKWIAEKFVDGSIICYATTRGISCLQFNRY